MNFPARIERPGAAGWTVIGIVLALILFPSLWLAVENAPSRPGLLWSTVAQGPFAGALVRSFVQAAWVAAISLVVGWPLGVLAGLTDWPGRRWALVGLAPPLFLPVFLWAIGWASWRAWLPYRYHHWVDGLPGCTLSLLPPALSLVMLATLLTTRTISRAAVESARLSGGVPALLLAGARLAFPAGLCAALFGAVLTLADPGPAQIMGYHGASSDILIALAARHDLAAAGLKSLALAVAILPIIAVLAWQGAGWANREFLGRDLGQPEAWRPRRGRWVIAGLIVAPVGLGIGLPVAGLLRPLFHPPITGAWNYATKAMHDSFGPTLWYNLTAGLVATSLGLALVLAAGRSLARRRLILFAGLLALGLTPALPALGWTRLAALAPASLDGLTRSGWMVGIALGLRLTPVAMLLLLGPWSRLPRSINESAALHGVTTARAIAQIWLPWLRPALAVAVVAVALLAVADVTTCQLLQPPGGSTFAMRLFTVMDNASERLVAALSFCYLAIGSAAAALAAIIQPPAKVRLQK